MIGENTSAQFFYSYKKVCWTTLSSSLWDPWSWPIQWMYSSGQTASSKPCIFIQRYWGTFEWTSTCSWVAETAVENHDIREEWDTGIALDLVSGSESEEENNGMEA